ncbi:DUF5007 domain-containing protein [Arcticibacter tournemirensis]|uniref:DUF5007 domain-containing protein n=2 Tax=Pseudomonadati TaxID=3379134 RepID=A0A4V1KIB7_9SPHI|nr:DUF5007 domain-containing protein [Arcticibacter tournemirensis]RXF70132.1 DUF5007 domain-containing protein [Arcticibacter tournemirensis]
MKKTAIYLIGVVLIAACSKIPEEKGFLSPDLYLKGLDTLYLPLGSKGSTDVAWLDGSTQPLEFSIENVRDAQGNRSEQFFKTYPYRTWTAPYNNKTDTTLDLVNAKIAEINMTPLSINPVNGMLQYLEVSRNLESPGDVFHLDVRVKNTQGERVYPDYSILKLSAKSRPFEVLWVTTAILLVNNSGATTFTLYDDIPENDIVRRQNIYDRNGKEFLDVYKTSNEPSAGVKVLIQYKDSEGRVFDSKEYQTYSSGTESYLDYAVNRKNTGEGAWVEFPITPWPAKQDLLSYLKGGTMDYSVLDTASLHRELYQEKKYAYLNPWPTREWGATKWYIRLRSRMIFRENGTYVISCRFPYTHLDKTF